MPQGLGREAIAHVLEQSSPGAYPSGNHTPFRYYTLNGRRSDRHVDDPLIGNDLNNPLDAQAPAPDLVEGAVDLAVPLCLNEIGLHLPGLLSVAAPSGAGPYTHVFTSGAREHNGLGYNWRDSNDWMSANTTTWQRMEISINPESGHRQVRFSGMASDVAPVAADPNGVPVAAMAFNGVPGGAGAVVRRNGSVIARVIGGSFVFERGLQAFRPGGRADRTAESFTPQVGSVVRATLEMRMLDNTFRDEALAKTPYPTEIEFELDASNKLTLSTPAGRFEPAVRGVGGEGLRNETWNLRGEQTAAAPALTATLINSIASYPVAA